MILGADDTHGIEQGSVTLVVIRQIGIELQTILFNRNRREARFLGLAEHTGEEVKVILDIMVLVILKEIDIIGIFSLHTLTAMRIIAFVTAGSADEIESTIVGAVRTALIAGHILIVTTSHFFAIGDSGENRGKAIGVNRTDDLIGMVMSLERHIYFVLLEDRQHTMAEDRRFLIGRVVRTGEEIEVGERYTPLRTGVRHGLVTEPGADMVGQIG